MEGSTQKPIADVTPQDVWDHLLNNDNAAIVDCRTSHEWRVVGTPDLSDIDRTMYHVEWRQAPDMSLNDTFTEELAQATGNAYPATLFFICRSGVRSKEAAAHTQELLSKQSIPCECVNVAEGFEGTQTPETIAAGTSGWRNRKLPWVNYS